MLFGVRRYRGGLGAGRCPCRTRNAPLSQGSRGRRVRRQPFVPAARLLEQPRPLGCDGPGTRTSSCRPFSIACAAGGRCGQLRALRGNAVFHVLTRGLGSARSWPACGFRSRSRATRLGHPGLAVAAVGILLASRPRLTTATPALEQARQDGSSPPALVALSVAAVTVSALGLFERRHASRMPVASRPPGRNLRRRRRWNDVKLGPDLVAGRSARCTPAETRARPQRALFDASGSFRLTSGEWRWTTPAVILSSGLALGYTAQGPRDRPSPVDATNTSVPGDVGRTRPTRAWAAAHRARCAARSELAGPPASADGRRPGCLRRLPRACGRGLGLAAGRRRSGWARLRSDAPGHGAWFTRERCRYARPCGARATAPAFSGFALRHCMALSARPGAQCRRQRAVGSRPEPRAQNARASVDPRQCPQLLGEA